MTLNEYDRELMLAKMTKSGREAFHREERLNDLRAQIAALEAEPAPIQIQMAAGEELRTVASALAGD